MKGGKKAKPFSIWDVYAVLDKYRTQSGILENKTAVRFINDMADAIGRSDLRIGAKTIGKNTIKPRCYDEFVKLSSRGMKRNPTKAEKRMLDIAKQYGIACLFQHVIKINKDKSYILDFFFPATQFNLEIDGEYHNSEEQKQKDKSREANLMAVRIKTFRFNNEDLNDKPEVIIKKLQEAGVIKLSLK